MESQHWRGTLSTQLTTMKNRTDPLQPNGKCAVCGSTDSRIPAADPDEKNLPVNQRTTVCVSCFGIYTSALALIKNTDEAIASGKLNVN